MTKLSVIMLKVPIPMMILSFIML